MKCSEVTVDGEAIAVFKDPVTDPGKRSKQGRLALVEHNGIFATVADHSPLNLAKILEVVYENGEIRREETLETICDRARP